MKKPETNTPLKEQMMQEEIKTAPMKLRGLCEDYRHVYKNEENG
jgi:hypothetical protein